MQIDSSSPRKLRKHASRVKDQASEHKSLGQDISLSTDINQAQNLAAESIEHKQTKREFRGNQHTIPPKDLAQFKKSLASGEKLYSAMISAGFPKSVAKQGVRRLPKPFLKALVAEKRRHIELAKTFSPEELNNYVMGGLISNTMQGEDIAVRSYELIGKHKSVDAWRADSATGVIVIQAAPIPSFDNIPQLKACDIETSK